MVFVPLLADNSVSSIKNFIVGVTRIVPYFCFFLWIFVYYCLVIRALGERSLVFFFAEDMK